MIKVMHCISDTNFGGAGRVLLNYLNHFDRSAFEIIVVIPKGSKLLQYLDDGAYRVVEFDGLYDRSYHRNDVKGLKDLICQYRPDVVHSHGALSARIAAKKCKCKIVYTRHSVFDLPKWQTMVPGKWLLGFMNTYYADRIIAVSPAAKTLLIESGTSADMIDVVFNGVEAMRSCDEETAQLARDRFGIRPNTFVCSIIARLEEVKGHKYVIDAAKLLKEQGQSDVQILIAGAGGIEEELKAYAAQQDVMDLVRFIGFVREMDQLLSVTDLQLNASFGTEATSMSLLEGFSLGVPAVVSDFGGNPFVVEHGENGLIFAKKDAHALFEAILAMKQDDALLKRCMRGAKQSFETRFTAEKMTIEMEKVYYKICEESGK